MHTLLAFATRDASQCARCGEKTRQVSTTPLFPRARICGVASHGDSGFNSAAMIRLLVMFLVSLGLMACKSTQREPPRSLALTKAPVLPLALDNDFSFRKMTHMYYDPRDPNSVRPTQNRMIAFERWKKTFGAVNTYDRAERYGHYYNVWWRAKREAAVTVRLEYRQQNLGSHVQAKEFHYPDAKGTIETTFTIIGDEYAEEGKVTSWRVLLIEDGKIVGLRQSFLWN